MPDELIPPTIYVLLTNDNDVVLLAPTEVGDYLCGIEPATIVSFRRWDYIDETWDVVDV